MILEYWLNFDKDVYMLFMQWGSNEEADSVEHLFVGCLYVKELIRGLNSLYKVNLLWNAPTLLENLSY